MIPEGFFLIYHLCESYQNTLALAHFTPALFAAAVVNVIVSSVTDI